jgi:hypothetical protein
VLDYIFFKQESPNKRFIFFFIYSFISLLMGLAKFVKARKALLRQETLLDNFIFSMVNLEDYKQSGLRLKAFGLNAFSSLLHIFSG